jgi:hypothetical protein
MRSAEILPISLCFDFSEGTLQHPQAYESARKKLLCVANCLFLLKLSNSPLTGLWGARHQQVGD